MAPDDNRRPGASPAFETTVRAFPFGGPNDAMNVGLSQNWWLVGLRGVLAILFGVLALALPGVTIASLVLLFGVYMVVDGIFAIAAAVRSARRHERWGALVFEGIVDLLAGAVALLLPAAAALAFVMLMGAWAVVSGAFLLAATFRLNVTHGRWLMGFGAVVSIIWGVLLMIWPVAGAIVLTWWMGAYALLFGAALLVLAVQLWRRRRDDAARDALPQGA